MASEMFKVIATFADASGRPLSGDAYSVTLMDEDRFFDDKLGKSTPNAEGAAEFLVAVADILSFDSSGERTPDLYFVVEHKGEEIFRSEVFNEVDFDLQDPVTGRKKGLTKSFGPFTVGDHAQG